ncbi:FG-GAP-like repeat-containing protein [Humisphaera borealis]|uniref:VCBS repeat-containing protein n=1 Tax=Humisphaera borealis TaxID=2807512 RepID=A0A7M2WYI9_9BACT|nr:FG-GAP-like repeat-containing protein [Humisphaera borealis]QOV90577.1 VCBS repeat-containing protein [Humisphaera borealis]
MCALCRSVDPTDFQLTFSGGVSAATAVAVNPVSPSVYNVAVSGIAGSGTLGLNLVDNGTIRDTAGHSLQSNAATAGLFASETTFAVGSRPFTVASADVNGDNKPDLITANFGSDNVSVLLGNGDGTFQAGTTFAVGDGPYCVAADVNGDNKPDLVTANYHSKSVSVLLGNGDGTFQAQKTFAVGIGPTSVIVEDMNADDKPDIATSNSVAGTVSVLLGNGDGSFEAQLTFAAGLDAGSLISADLNGDDNPDLIATNYYSTTVSVLLGNGDGTFQARQVIAVGSSTATVTSADVNNDGKADLVTGNWASDTISVLLGKGDGTFQAEKTFNVSEPWYITSVEVDGDGKIDLIVVDEFNDKVKVLLGNGDGTFKAQKTYDAGSSPVLVEVVDVNGDARLDLITANFNSDTVSVLLNSGRGNFTGQTYTIQVPPSNSAVYTVTSLGDSAGTVTAAGPRKFNATTLRAAIAAANSHLGNDAIEFAPGLKGMITLSTALPQLSDNVVLRGPGASLLTVARSPSEASNFSIFFLNAGKTATISGLGIAKGTGVPVGPSGITAGGGIFNNGALRITDCVLTENSSKSTGGGIYSAGNLTATNCTFTGNSAQDGGAIYTTGTATSTLQSCNLAGNWTGQGGRGGGISNGGALTIDTSLLVANSAGRAGTGGGVYNGGSLVLRGSTVAGNAAQQGGGIYHAGNGSFIASNAIVAMNLKETCNVNGQVTATNPDDLFGASTSTASSFNLIGTGGSAGMANGVNHNIVGVDPGFLLNPSSGADGIRATADDGPGNFRLRPDSRALNGGANNLVAPGITMDIDGRPRVVDGTVDIGAYEMKLLRVSSSATGGSTGQSWSSAFRSLSGALGAASPGTNVLVEAGTYLPGTASARSASFSLGAGVSVFGGYAGNSNPLNPNQRDISGFKTILSGDIGRPNDNSDNSYHVVTAVNGGAPIVLDGVTITAGNANDASALNGKFGGGLLIIGSSAVLRDCLVNHNSALGSGGGIAALLGSNVDVKNSEVSQNKAGVDGGAMHTSEGARLSMTGGKAIGNLAGALGGMLGAGGQSKFEITGVDVAGNKAKEGGAISVKEKSSGIADQCKINGNEGSVNGGGFRIKDEGAVDVKNSEVSQNKAGVDGGAMHTSEGARLSMTGGKAIGNFAGVFGGMLGAGGQSKFEMTGVDVASNKAKEGGAIAVKEKASGIADQCKINGNEGSVNGGGFRIKDEGAVDVKNSEVSQNKAGVDGGAMHTSEGARLSMTGGKGIGNLAGALGGMLGAGGQSRFTMTGVDVASNKAKEGGAIAVKETASGIADECKINGNEGSVNGGGFRIKDEGAVDVKNSEVSQNKAGVDGGAMHTSENARLSMTGGKAIGNFAGVFGGMLGAGGQSKFEMTGVDVAGNKAKEGGAIATNEESVGAVTQCLVNGNQASGLGGALAALGSSTLGVTNSTLSGNMADKGGAIGVSSIKRLFVGACTIVGNTAAVGGGIAGLGAAIGLFNAIVCGNFGLLTTLRSSESPSNDIEGTIGSDSSSNLVGVGGSGGIVNGKNGNLVGITLAQLKLGPLADNGGPTQAMALLPGSIAINAGSNAKAVDAAGKPIATDQRGTGFARIVGGIVDVGAFEVQSPVVTGKGSVAGIVFKDLNGNRIQDADESGVKGWLVWADLNKDGRLNYNEPRTVSNAGGQYTLTNVPTGYQLVRLEKRTGWQQTIPRGGGAHGPTILTDKLITGWHFGIRPILG